MESTCPSTPGGTLVFENTRVRASPMTLEPGRMFDFHQYRYDHLVLWQDSGQAVAEHLGDPDWRISPAAEPGFVQFHTVGTAESLARHRIREAGDTAVTHDIIELTSERSPGEKRLPARPNGRGTFTGPNSQEQA
ncbi:hypothetical protein [Glycomyces tarimensis]